MRLVRSCARVCLEHMSCIKHVCVGWGRVEEGEDDGGGTGAGRWCADTWRATNSCMSCHVFLRDDMCPGVVWWRP
jgi:hypothetical protein